MNEGCNCKTDDARNGGTGIGQVAREPTVGEVLDIRINDAERSASLLRKLKASLAGSYLASGCSNIPHTWFL